MKTYAIKTIHLHPEQLVIEALETMLLHERYALPVHYKGRCSGIIYFKDLIEFLVNRRYGHSMLFHKLNFNLEGAITALVQMYDSN